MSIETCRICCTYNSVNVSLFDVYQDEYNVVDIIFMFSSIQFKFLPHGTNSICKLCANKLVDFYLFRKQIIESQQSLIIKSENDVIEPEVKSEITFITIKDETPAESVDVKHEGIRTIGKVSSHVKGKTDTQNKRPAVKGPDAAVSRKGNIEKALPAMTIATKKVEQFICDKCGRVLKRRTSFLSHYLVTHLKQIERKKCPHCPRLFTMSSGCASSVRRHIKAVHSGQLNDVAPSSTCFGVKCNECDNRFTSALELYEHSKVHTENCRERDDGYDLNCDECDIELDSYDSYTSHMQNRHNVANEDDLKPAKCRWCNERYRNLQGLYTHVRTSHKFKNQSIHRVADGGDEEINQPHTMGKVGGATNNPTNFLCTICGKFLSTATTYKSHMNIHSGVKPYSCNQCDARFSQRCGLTLHKTSHATYRRYKCTECQKAFKQSTHLKEHLITHGIGIKRKFPCSVCHKEFLFQGALNQHMWVHKKGEARPYTCTDCGKGFIRRHKMIAHQIKEHSSECNETNTP